MKIKVSYRKDGSVISELIPIESVVKFRYSSYNDRCRTVYADNWGTICMEDEIESIEVVNA